MDTLMLDTALRYYQAGLTVLPNDPIKKYPADLREWQTITPTEQMIRAWYQRPGRAIGIRDIEGLDFDNKGAPNAETLYSDWYALCDALAPGLPAKLLLEQTPSGGYHVAWRCEIISGNQKLATRPPTAEERRHNPRSTFVTLIETRGKGGQFQVAPSPGYTLLRGDWAALPIITPAERQIVLDGARALSQTDSRTIQNLQTSGDRPGDKYNAEHADDARALLESTGWRIVYQRGDVLYLRRPGKDHGISATLGYVAPGVLYVFSSSAAPFEPGHAYSPFAVYTQLQHNGDYKAAAAALRSVDAKTGEIIEKRNAPPAKPVGKVEYVVADWRSAGITLAQLQHKEFVPERWIIESILPEGACLLAAKYKSKKSWLALALGCSIAMGGKALGRLGVSLGRVLYLDLEGKQQRIQKRTRAMLGVQHIAWPDNFHVYEKWPQGDEGMKELEHWFASYPDTALVVIDVLASFRRPIERHEEIYRYDRDTIDPLNGLFERNHAAGLLVHHFNKGKHDDIMDSITGSTGIPSAVNTMWGLTRDVNDSTITILHLRGRDLENDEPLALKWDSFLNMHIIEGPAVEVATSTERKAVLQVLSDDTPRSPKEIASELGKSVETVKQLLRKLLNDGIIDKPAYGQYAIVRKRDHSDHSDHSDTSDHGDTSSKSDRQSERVIGSLLTDHSSLTHPNAQNGKSDRSDRYYKGDFSIDCVEVGGRAVWRLWDDITNTVLSEYDTEAEAQADAKRRKESGA